MWHNRRSLCPSAVKRKLLQHLHSSSSPPVNRRTPSPRFGDSAPTAGGEKRQISRGIGGQNPPASHLPRSVLVCLAFDRPVGFDSFKRNRAKDGCQVPLSQDPFFRQLPRLRGTGSSAPFCRLVSLPPAHAGTIGALEFLTIRRG
jgi:hypothetical protein